MRCLHQKHSLAVFKETFLLQSVEAQAPGALTPRLCPRLPRLCPRTLLRRPAAPLHPVPLEGEVEPAKETTVKKARGPRGRPATRSKGAAPPSTARAPSAKAAPPVAVAAPPTPPNPPKSQAKSKFSTAQVGRLEEELVVARGLGSAGERRAQVARVAKELGVAEKQVATWLAANANKVKKVDVPKEVKPKPVEKNPVTEPTAAKETETSTFGQDVWKEEGTGNQCAAPQQKEL